MKLFRSLSIKSNKLLKRRGHFITNEYILHVFGYYFLIDLSAYASISSLFSYSITDFAAYRDNCKYTFIFEFRKYNSNNLRKEEALKMKNIIQICVERCLQSKFSRTGIKENLYSTSFMDKKYWLNSPSFWVLKVSVYIGFMWLGWVQ